MIQRSEGRCRCGRWLIIERYPGVPGFSSFHELPECDDYRELCAGPGVTCTGLEVIEAGSALPASGKPTRS